MRQNKEYFCQFTTTPHGPTVTLRVQVMLAMARQASRPIRCDSVRSAQSSVACGCGDGLLGGLDRLRVQATATDLQCTGVALGGRLANLVIAHAVRTTLRSFILLFLPRFWIVADSRGMVRYGMVRYVHEGV